MRLIINTAGNPTELERAIIEDFWQFDDNKFSYTVAEIKQKHFITKRDLNKILNSKSFVEYYKGLCNDCGKLIFIHVMTREEVLENLNKGTTNCFKCWSKHLLNQFFPDEPKERTNSVI